MAKIYNSKILRKIREIRFHSTALVKNSTSLTILVIISVSIFILGGGIYDILEEPMAFLPTPTRPIFYYPGLGEQTYNESLYFIFFLTLGVVGGFLSFWSTGYAYRPREAKMALLVGLVMLGLALLGCEWIITLKQGA